MKELLDYYYNQAGRRRSPLTWVADLQQKALTTLAENGFPTRKDEEWKYTRVEGLVQEQFNPPSLLQSQDVPPLDAPDSYLVQLLNGQVTVYGKLPAGVLVLPLAQALKEHDDLVRPHLNRTLTHPHAFQALNTAHLEIGIFVYVPKGVTLDRPILLSHWQDQPQQSVYLRHLILTEQDSEATVIELYRGKGECTYFTNVLTEAVVQAGSKLRHYKVQQEGLEAYHIGHLGVCQYGGSRFESHAMSFGSKLARSDIDITFLEEKAECLMNGIYAPNANQHIDHHTIVRHNVPNCVSDQDYKGILSGKSHAVFNGKVLVAKDAQHTEARQQNKNLLLSAHAEIDTKPQLEIFADDVICTHGATVGQLDEDALFYLATRGIEPEEAKAFLIHAFAKKNISLIPDAEIASWISQWLNQQLG